MIRPGIGSWTFPWAIGFPSNTYEYEKWAPIDLLEYAFQNQIDLVQLYNNVELTNITQENLDQLKDFAQDRGIRIEIGGVGIAPRYLHEMLRIAQLFSSSSVRTIIPLHQTEDRFYHPSEAAAILSESIVDFEQAGITLLIENHDRYTSKQYLEIIEAVDSKSMGLCFDSANSLGNAEHFRESFDILKDHIKVAHFKEYSIERLPTKMGFIIQGCKPGTNQAFGKEFIDMIASLNRDIDVVFEQWVPFQGSIKKTLQVEADWAKTGIRLLQSLIMDR